MIIYGEYLFLENFITGVILLFFTGKIVGEMPTGLRIFLCGIFSGIYAFVLFLPMGGIISLLGKCAFSLLISFAAFRWKGWKRTLQNGAVFIGTTILYGGIAIALLTSFSWTGVTAAAGVYLPPVTYLTVTAAAVVAALFLWFLLNLMKEKKMEKRFTAEVILIADGKKWSMMGFIDSGNLLTDPITGNPVCIIERKQADLLLESIGTPERRYTLIPYRAVGTDHGILEGYRFDEIHIDGKSIKSIVVAVSGEQQLFQQDRHFQIILPAALLERGIYGDS